MVDAQALSEDVKSSIMNVAELTDQLAVTKESCSSQTKEHETEVTRLNSLVSQKMLFQRRTGDALGHASGAVVFFATSLKKGRKSS